MLKAIGCRTVGVVDRVESVAHNPAGHNVDKQGMDTYSSTMHTNTFVRTVQQSGSRTNLAKRTVRSWPIVDHGRKRTC